MNNLKISKFYKYNLISDFSHDNECKKNIDKREKLN